MKISVYPVLVLFLVFNGSATTQAQVKKNMQPAFNANEQFEFKNVIITEVFDGKQPTLKQAYNFTLLLNVVGKDATGKVMIRAQYIKQGNKLEDLAKKETVGYNSDAPDEFINTSNDEGTQKMNQLYKDFNDALLNKPFTIYFKEKSGSVEVTGVDSVVEEALKKVSLSYSAYSDGFKGGVQAVFSNEAMQHTLEAAFNYLPGKPVGVGEGWTKNVTVEETPLKLGYTVKAIQPDSIGIVAVANPVVNNGYHVTVSMKGNITIDAKTGLLVRSAIRSEMKAVPGSGSQFLMVKREQNELVKVVK